MRKSLANTKAASEELLELKSYIAPIERTRQFNESIRQAKSKGVFSVTSECVSLVPPPQAKAEEFRNRYAIEPSRKFHYTKHSGKWEFNEREKRHMWSDTGSFEFESVGDQKFSHNPDSRNLEGPCLPAATSGFTRRINLIEKRKKLKDILAESEGTAPLLDPALV